MLIKEYYYSLQISIKLSKQMQISKKDWGEKKILSFLFREPYHHPFRVHWRLTMISTCGTEMILALWTFSLIAFLYTSLYKKTNSENKIKSKTNQPFLVRVLQKKYSPLSSFLCFARSYSSSLAVTFTCSSCLCLKKQLKYIKTCCG